MISSRDDTMREFMGYLPEVVGWMQTTDVDLQISSAHLIGSWC